ncbi:MAG: hypothetical protein J7L23_03200 [Candidatus Diapherotrites archaeon]|nr:hypothetical protein [Candidatus Diapherotrites archaeon]
MEKAIGAHLTGINEFPDALVKAGEEAFLDVVHAFLTTVLLTCTGVILFNPVLFRNTAFVAVVAGIAIIDLLISHRK